MNSSLEYMISERKHRWGRFHCNGVDTRYPSFRMTLPTDVMDTFLGQRVVEDTT